MPIVHFILNGAVPKKCPWWCLKVIIQKGKVFEYCHSEWERKCIHVPFVRGTPQYIHRTFLDGGTKPSLELRNALKRNTYIPSLKLATFAPEKMPANPKGRQTSSSNHQFSGPKGFGPKSLWLWTLQELSSFSGRIFYESCPIDRLDFYNPKCSFCMACHLPTKTWVLWQTGAPNLLR